jgi:hypothetical protein
MMLETTEAVRIEVHGDPATGGLALYDSRDGAISGVIAFDTLTVELGMPLRYTWQGTVGELAHGDILNALVIHSG